MFIDRRSFKHFDWLSFGIIMALCALSILFVMSSTYEPETPYSLFFKKQLLGVAGGIVIYFLCSATDYRSIMHWSHTAYFAAIGLLIFTMIKGHIGMGAQRWINLGFFKLQPSELAKLFFPGYLVYHFYREKNMVDYSFANFMPILVTLAFSALLILKQPDLGTTLILIFSALILLWLIGIDKRFFTYGMLAGILLTPVLWHGLKTYQKQRIMVFIGYGDDRKERYQIEQSKIAIGSGGITGKGFMKGTQNNLSFLPESRTDFIFSVVGEEWGLLGVLFLISLYLILFVRMFMIIMIIQEPLIQILAFGLVAHIIFSMVVNIGMVIDLLPIVGIPLPLMSYGISNLWVTFASLGWFQSISMQRYNLRKESRK